MSVKGVIKLARKPRIWYPGAMYHIFKRGNRKLPLFYETDDYHAYMYFLELTRRKFPFHLHAYCLMPNHIHLQLETINDEIHHIMHKLNFRYAIYLNKRYDFVGHVFQGRYGAKLIETRAYLLDVSRYIHLNPVEAKIVSTPEQYEWSSYQAYITGSPNPHITTDKILSQFPEPKREHYRMFVESKPIGGLSH